MACQRVDGDPKNRVIEKRESTEKTPTRGKEKDLPRPKLSCPSQGYLKREVHMPAERKEKTGEGTFTKKGGRPSSLAPMGEDQRGYWRKNGRRIDSRGPICEQREREKGGGGKRIAAVGQGEGEGLSTSYSFQKKQVGSVKEKRGVGEHYLGIQRRKG